MSLADTGRFAGLLCLIFCANAMAQAVREQEIATCHPGEVVNWQDGIDRPSAQPAWHVIYRHEGAPHWFSASEVESLVVRAARAWGECGIPLTLVTDRQADAARPDTILVHWSEQGSRGNFGLAHLGQRTLSLGPAAFALLRERNPRHPAGETLQMTLSHELGHFLGLMAHSRRCVDVLSYYHDGKGGRCILRDPTARAGVIEYRHLLPTACDIQRCRSLNRRSP